MGKFLLMKACLVSGVVCDFVCITQAELQSTAYWYGWFVKVQLDIFVTCRLMMVNVAADHFSMFCWHLSRTVYGMRYKFKLATYVRGPLVIDRRGSTERNLNEIMTGSRLLTLAVKVEGQSRISAMRVSASEHVM
jgi:hypothetical protein